MEHILKKRVRYVMCALIPFIVWVCYRNYTVTLTIPSSTKNITIRMSRAEKHSLEWFFKDMIGWDGAGYVLLGKKPMWMGTYLTPFTLTSWQNFIVSIHPWNIKTYKGWKVWQKYQHLFNTSGNFVIWCEKNPFWPEPHPSYSIYCVNKQNMNHIIDQYGEDFETVLGQKIRSSNELLNTLGKESFFKTTLANHDGLIGTLFGYGRENAWKFEARHNDKSIKLSLFWGPEIYDFLSNRVNMGLLLGLFPKELAELIGYPSFLADNDTQETKALRAEFLKTRGTIINYYDGKDFLLASLQLFTKPPYNDLLENIRDK